jgi:hypothetical protein
MATTAAIPKTKISGGTFFFGQTAEEFAINERLRAK